MGPELIDPEQFGLKSSHPTEASDCYALGMVIYETISGNLPFHGDADLTVFAKVIQGKRPPRGGKFRKDLWGMLERCWESQPSSRPSIGEVLRCLETLSDSP
jgi:serine/threonine protein kinase